MLQLLIEVPERVRNVFFNACRQTPQQLFPLGPTNLSHRFLDIALMKSAAISRIHSSMTRHRRPSNSCPNVHNCTYAAALVVTVNYVVVINVTVRALS